MKSPQSRIGEGGRGRGALGEVADAGKFSRRLRRGNSVGRDNQNYQRPGDERSFHTHLPLLPVARPAFDRFRPRACRGELSRRALSLMPVFRITRSARAATLGGINTIWILDFRCSIAGSYHRMTRSALANRFGGMTNPICLAVFKLTKNSNLLGDSTGRSAGFAPLAILSTKFAARRNRSVMLAP